MRTTSTSMTVADLQRRDVIPNGTVRPEVQRAAELLFPLPPVVINRTANHWTVLVGNDTLESLFNYQSDVHWQARRVKETKLTVIEVIVKDDEDQALLATYLKCFVG